MKIRERHPTDLELDCVLRIALQLEAWTADTTRCCKATKNKQGELKRSKNSEQNSRFYKSFPEESGEDVCRIGETNSEESEQRWISEQLSAAEFEQAYRTKPL